MNIFTIIILVILFFPFIIIVATVIVEFIKSIVETALMLLTCVLSFIHTIVR